MGPKAAELVKLPEAELKKKFDEAANLVRTGPPKADASNEEKLKVYGLFKQASQGDNNEAAPWAVQFEAKAKWDAWNANKGKSKQQAMAEYVEHVMNN